MQENVKNAYHMSLECKEKQRDSFTIICDREKQNKSSHVKAGNDISAGKINVFGQRLNSTTAMTLCVYSFSPR